jgi:hypothetical protein
MADDDPVEGRVKRENEKKNIWRVEYAGLERGKKGVSAKVEWVPERELAGFQAFHPEVPVRDEKGCQIPLDEKTAAPEDIREKNEDEKEEGEDRESLSCPLSPLFGVLNCSSQYPLQEAAQSV